MIGCDGGIERFVGMVERKLGLGEVVVAFHVVLLQLDGLDAVVDAGIP